MYRMLSECCYSYYPKGWPLRLICSTPHSTDKETEAQSLEGTDFKSKGSSHLFSCPLASSKDCICQYLGIQQLWGPTWILPSLLDYKKGPPLELAQSGGAWASLLLPTPIWVGLADLITESSYCSALIGLASIVFTFHCPSCLLIHVLSPSKTQSISTF